MEKIFNFFKNVTHLLIIIALVALSVFYSITYNAGAPTRFVAFLANAISYIFILAIFITSLILIVFKKDKQANMILYVYSMYYLITYTLNYLNAGYLARQGANGSAFVYGLFYFLGGLLLLAIIVFLALIKVFNFKFEKILDLLVLIMLGFYVVLFIVGLIRYIKIEAGWSAYFTLIAETLIMPILLVSLYIEARPEPKKEEVKEENNEGTTN